MDQRPIALQKRCKVWLSIQVNEVRGVVKLREQLALELEELTARGATDRKVDVRVGSWRPIR